MASESQPHVFLVSFPGQGHVNPLLRLGKRLASKGLLVTFSAPEGVGRDMRKANSISDKPTPVGDGFIRFEFFEDGWEENDPRRQDMDQYLPQLELVCKQVLRKMLEKYAQENRPVSCLINNPFIPWVSDVASELGLPSAVLWVQSCASFSAYYHYYHNMVPFPTEKDPETEVQLPCMPILKHDEIPSFLHPSTAHPFIRRAILGQFKNLDKPFCIFMDTFHELEKDIIEYMSEIYPIRTVGPLFKNPEPEAPNSDVRGDLVKVDDCMDWLDKKPTSSVVYISFGSVVYVNQDQRNEIAYGLLSSGVSFLWAMKPRHKDLGSDDVSLPEGFLEKAGDRGKVVQWSPQEKVLEHPSVACFVTHCGWNSSMEALTAGVPVVAFPQWGDQVTNAKYLVDVYKVGVSVCRGEAAKELITRDKVEKCLIQATVGQKAAEMKQSALKWKAAAEAAVARGDKKIQAFVDEVKRSVALTGESEKTISCKKAFQGVTEFVEKTVNKNTRST